VITARGKKESYAFAPIAVDASMDELYFTTQDEQDGGWDAADHAARSLTTRKADSVDLSKDCNVHGTFGYEYSLAVTKDYLMFTCGDPFALFVYNKRAGRQQVVETLPFGYGIVLWPDIAPISQ